MILCMEINTRHFFLTIWMSSRSIDDINRSALIFWAAVVFLVNLYWFLFSLGGESSRPGNAIYMHRPVTETICIFCLVTSFIYAFFFYLLYFTRFLIKFEIFIAIKATLHIETWPHIYWQYTKLNNDLEVCSAHFRCKI